MRYVFDAFWRAGAYCLHPRVIGLSLLPVVLAGVLAVGLSYWFWEPAVAGLRTWLENWSLVAALLQWLDSVGATGFRAVMAPLLVVALALPVIVVVSLLLVAMLMTPSIVSLVAERRFVALERRRGASFLQSALWSLGYSAMALLALLVTVPLWLLPPLVLVLPPLIWGWLSYKVMSFDVLAEHATPAERRTVMAEHRWPLLAIGVVSGFLGAVPSLIWAFGALALVFAPVLIVVSIWLYTLVFAFSALWFAHYALHALQGLRSADATRAAAASPFPAAHLPDGAGTEAHRLPAPPAPSSGTP